jgi:hypothetical protein
MIYRIAIGVVVICFMAIGFILGPSNTTQPAQTQAQPAQQAPTPAQPSEDESLKGLKFQ